MFSHVTKVLGEKNEQEKEDKKVKGSVKVDYSSKTVRQAAFRAECKRLGLTPEEAVEKGKLFQGIDVTRFKLVHMSK